MSTDDRDEYDGNLPNFSDDESISPTSITGLNKKLISLNINKKSINTKRATSSNTKLQNTTPSQNIDHSDINSNITNEIAQNQVASSKAEVTT
jgi:hypothetical protein